MGRMFSPHKKKQIKRFFGNANKIARLYARAKSKGLTEKPGFFVTNLIFHAKIGKNIRTIKVARREPLQKGNLAILMEAHSAALRDKKIRAANYTLRPVEYFYAGNTAGIMEKVNGCGADVLKRVFYKEAIFPSKWISEKQVEEGKRFLKMHPKITLEKLENALAEISRDLEKSFAHSFEPTRGGFSNDISAGSNLIVTDFDEKTNKINFVLIDQLYPGDNNAVMRRLKSKNKR